jgi:hypothetical protein
MESKMKRTLVVCALLGASLAAPVFAIFGVGDIVFDPSNFEEAVQQLLEMQQQYAQLVQSNQMLRNQYNQMLWMAKQVPVIMAACYRAIATPWQTAQRNFLPSIITRSSRFASSGSRPCRARREIQACRRR